MFALMLETHWFLSPLDLVFSTEVSFAEEILFITDVLKSCTKELFEEQRFR